MHHLPPVRVQGVIGRRDVDEAHVQGCFLGRPIPCSRSTKNSVSMTDRGNRTPDSFVGTTPLASQYMLEPNITIFSSIFKLYLYGKQAKCRWGSCNRNGHSAMNYFNRRIFPLLSDVLHFQHMTSKFEKQRMKSAWSVSVHVSRNRFCSRRNSAGNSPE